MGEADQAFSSQVQERWYDLSADGRLVSQTFCLSNIL